MSKEKVKIFDLQQQQQTALAYQIPNQLIETINYDTINVNELQRNHEKLLSENKQIEVTILKSRYFYNLHSHTFNFRIK